MVEQQKIIGTDPSNTVDVANGMAVYTSNHRLARAVFEADPNMIATVSVTGIGVVLARLLQLGDKDTLNALDTVPPALSNMAKRVKEKYYEEGGIGPNKKFKYVPMPTIEEMTLTPERPFSDLIDLTILGAFTEVRRAKMDKQGRVDEKRKVAVNVMIKTQLTLLASIYGAMLADPYGFFAGAGSPHQLPRIIDQLKNHREAYYNLEVIGAPYGKYKIGLNPQMILEGPWDPLSQSNCFPIVSSVPYARRLDESRKSEGIEHAFQCYMFEEKSAGGHNPYSKIKQKGRVSEIVFGEKDKIDYTLARLYKLLFWVAGSVWDKPLEEGALGNGFGSIFALSKESGFLDEDIMNIYRLYNEGNLQVITSGVASPSGLPFKLVLKPGSVADPDVYNKRKRICDISHLCELYEIQDGIVGYRCPAEPIAKYTEKGGDINNAIDDICLCNGLTATVGLGQRRGKYREPKVYTLGADYGFLEYLAKDRTEPYSVAEAIDLVKKRRLLKKVS